MKRIGILLAVFAVFFFICSILSSPAWSVPQRSTKVNLYDPSLYKAMEWRCIGPYRGGRVTDRWRCLENRRWRHKLETCL